MLRLYRARFIFDFQLCILGDSFILKIEQFIVGQRLP